MSARPKVEPFLAIMYGDCPVWREHVPTPNGTAEVRCIRLPSGNVYRATVEKLTEVVVTTLTDPAENPERVAVLDRMLDPDEWSIARSILADLGQPVYH